VIVLDASAGVSALLNNGMARRLVSEQVLHVPHLVDVEVASALRRQVAVHALAAGDAQRALRTWSRLGVIRYSAPSLLDRVWELREAVSAYHAVYVALAEGLDCPLVTADKRLSRATGIRCVVTLVPN
jgi:predicted nucleic acid-binding protein